MTSIGELTVPVTGEPSIAMILALYDEADRILAADPYDWRAAHTLWDEAARLERELGL